MKGRACIGVPAGYVPHCLDKNETDQSENRDEGSMQKIADRFVSVYEYDFARAQQKPQ